MFLSRSPNISLFSFNFTKSSSCVAAMASLVDSAAHFDARINEVDLTRASLTALQNAGVLTLSNLGFAVGQPGQPIATPDVTNFLQAAFGRPATLLETNAIKRVLRHRHISLPH